MRTRKEGPPSAPRRLPDRKNPTGSLQGADI